MEECGERGQNLQTVVEKTMMTMIIMKLIIIDTSIFNSSDMKALIFQQKQRRPGQRMKPRPSSTIKSLRNAFVPETGYNTNAYILRSNLESQHTFSFFRPPPTPYFSLSLFVQFFFFLGIRKRRPASNAILLF